MRIADLGGDGGTLDHAAAWMIQADAQAGARIGFVATNATTQGEPGARL